MSCQISKCMVSDCKHNDNCSHTVESIEIRSVADQKITSSVGMSYGKKNTIRLDDACPVCQEAVDHLIDSLLALARATDRYARLSEVKKE